MAREIHNAQRKRMRLMERARGLSDSDLAEILQTRAVAKAQAVAKAAAKAKAKGKGKAKAKAKAKGEAEG